ncbi:hypothetical protein SDC9_194579 [bioreactor metagenome]|uniref:MPN domain-containing protein n=1 Tax=bioreactor metagenome TaxID=1076179 RepID=A0A645I791_9ZZZZ
MLINSAENELINISGVGIKRAAQIKAIAELARRLYSNVYNVNKYKITQPKDAANLLMNDMRFLKKEYLKVILLNTKNEVISIETISIGSLNASITHPRETFISAIRKSAASIILAHNHPSGDPSPSSEDISLTNRIRESGKLLGIELLDHIIIGDLKYVSLKEQGIL